MFKNPLLLLLTLLVTVEVCQAGVYRYRKNAHSTEPAHKLRHTKSAYNRNCFFSPVNCVVFLNAEPGINPSSFSEADVQLVEYHKSDNTIRRYNKDGIKTTEEQEVVSRKRRSGRKPQWSY